MAPAQTFFASVEFTNTNLVNYEFRIYGEYLIVPV